MTISSSGLKPLRRSRARAWPRGSTSCCARLWLQSLARKSTKLELEGWDAQLQPAVDILDRDKRLDLMNRR